MHLDDSEAEVSLGEHDDFVLVRSFVEHVSASTMKVKVDTVKVKDDDFLNQNKCHI